MSRLISVVLVLALAWAAPAIGATSPAGPLPTGTLRATFIGTNPVQATIDPRTGEARGPAAELARELAKKLGVTAKVTAAEGVRGVLDSVKKGDADIGFLAYDSGRAAEVDFSQPYSLGQNTFIVLTSSPISTVPDIDRPGTRIGATVGDRAEMLFHLRKKKQRMSEKAMRISFTGDSFVSGVYDLECVGWAGRISASARRRGHDISPYNLGVRGETSVQILRRWRAEAEARQSPQQEGRLVFEFGVNDAREVNGKRQLEAAQSLAAAREILGAGSKWKPTLMIGPPPCGDEPRLGRINDLSQRLAMLCAELTVPFFDSYARLLASTSWMPCVNAVDGTHPSGSGYAEWAQLIDAWPAWREWLP